jgi:hypothetical protein
VYTLICAHFASQTDPKMRFGSFQSTGIVCSNFDKDTFLNYKCSKVNIQPSGSNAVELGSVLPEIPFAITKKSQTRFYIL